jgi:hypothetical protein
MQLTDQAQVRREVRESQVLHQLNSIVPPKDFLELDKPDHSRKPRHRVKPAKQP